MSRPTIEERLISGVVGGVIGAVIGLVLGWLCGVYSSSPLFPKMPLDIGHWILVSAAAFGILGLIIGSDIGSVSGGVFDAIFQAESESDGIPMWVVQVLAIAGLVWLCYLLVKG